MTRQSISIAALRHPEFVGLLSLASAVLLASTALGQPPEQSLVLPAEIDVRGRGWSQIANMTEVLDFGLCLIEATLFTSLLAFHPVNLHYRTGAHLSELQKGLFLFALIGMLTGFLVIHHGYLIGFVIFGIGGLFRFRMKSSSISDTGQMVIGALAGLAVGLDLPVMALVGTAAAWIVLYVFGKTQSLALEVKFKDDQSGAQAVEELQAHLSAKGFSNVSASKAKFKLTARLVLTSRKPHAESLLARALAELQDRPDSGVADWHID